jgi:hypothetical protein
MPLDIVGVTDAEPTDAEPAVAMALLSEGDPDKVTTSLPLSGMAAEGVMLMVTVTGVAPARTSGRDNTGPTRPPSTMGSAVAVFCAVSCEVESLKLPPPCTGPSVAPVHVTERAFVLPGLADSFIVCKFPAVTLASNEENVYPVLNVHVAGLI